MRLIDADGLIDEICRAECEKAHADCDYRGGRCESVKAVMDSPTVGGWISADKRPPKQGRYLVWGLAQIVPDHNDEPNGYWQTKIAQWFETIGWDCKVKFWQMLPEPPKEVSAK